MRITGGTLRGRPLAVPPGARPTEGRVREALFSIWGGELEGARVLDLFAGSGVVALEALGRGALSACAVDHGLRAVKTIEANAAKVGEPLTVRKLPLPEGLSRLAAEGLGPFDLIFADPPYEFTDYELLLLRAAPLLVPGGQIVIEHRSRRSLPLEAGSLVRPMLVFRSGAYLLDQPAVRELQLQGVGIPAATLDAVGACANEYWLIPRGEAPFSGRNGYAAVFLRPLYPDALRARFLAAYVKEASTDYYDVWRCRR